MSKTGSATQNPRHLRVFLASPGDVADDRPGLRACLDYLRPGDALVVWKLDRLGWSLPHLLQIIAELREKGAGFRSLTEQMDTTTLHGELLFHLFGALAQYERALTQERIQAGLAAARHRGRQGRRPLALDHEKLAAVLTALNAGISKAAMCHTFGIPCSTLNDTLTRAGWGGHGA